MSKDTKAHSPGTADWFLDQVLAHPHFVERHRRVVHAPADRVWEAALSVAPPDIRLLAPFMAVRSLPKLRQLRQKTARLRDRRSMLEVMQAEGFVQLHRDARVIDGRAFAAYGAAGRFWSPAGNSPVALDGPDAFRAYSEPGMAKTAFFLEVVDCGDRCELVTETRISGTDAAASRAFGRYWLIIRGPSGLIRRSWLAAIDRRARA